MGNFNQIAKSLLTQVSTPPVNVGRESVTDKLDSLKLLSENGFSPREVLRDLRELYDACETDEKAIRLQISKLMIQVLGMLKNEEVQRAVPSITFVIQGDNNRINTMLCPLATEAA